MQTVEEIENGQKLVNTLSGIHWLILNSFEYKSDKEQYKLNEKWVEPDESFSINNLIKIYGDCEDFALHCRKLLNDKNIKSRLIYCLTEKNEGHLVLECDGFILDNRFTTIKTNISLRKLGYKFLRISGFNSGDPWFQLN